MIITDRSQFNARYWASRDPRVLALQQLNTADGFPNTGARLAAAHPLAQSGLILAAGIDIDGLDPFLYMRDLASLGFVWYSALFQQELPTSQILDYQDASKAWPNSVKISLDDGDYPPFSQPEPPPVNLSPVANVPGVNGQYPINASVFFKDGQPQYHEGSIAIAPANGETVYAHFGSSGIVSGIWMWETAQARAARIAAGG